MYGNNNKATVSIRFGNGSKKSALLERYNGTNTSNAIDNFTIGGLEGLVPNYFNGSVPYWTHADFLMTYDPCVCQTTNSRLYVELKIASQSILNFTINGQIIQDLKPSVNNTNPSFTSTLKPFIDGIQQVASIEFTQKESSKTVTRLDPNDKTKTQFLVPTFFEILGALGGIAAKWAGLGDYFTTLFNPNKPDRPVPMMFDVKLEGNGSINFEGIGKTAIVAVPGSNLSGTDPKHIPAYNQPLGTFNLLWQPQVNISQSDGPPFESLAPLDCDTKYNYYKFSLMSPLSYVYNPNMDISWFNLNCRASYVITLSDGKRILTEDYPLGCFGDFKPVYKAKRQFGSCHLIEPYPVDVAVQIFIQAWRPSGIQTIFMQVYNVTKNYANNATTLEDEYPSPNCVLFSLPASWMDIYAACNYSNYPSRTNSLTGNDSIPENEYLAENAKYNRLSRLKGITNSNRMDISPNPMGEQSIITYEVAEESTISLYLTDISGKRVQSFIQTELHKNGKYEFSFMKNELAIGMYFVVLESNTGKVTKKLIIQ